MMCDYFSNFFVMTSVVKFFLGNKISVKQIESFQTCLEVTLSLWYLIKLHIKNNVRLC